MMPSALSPMLFNAASAVVSPEPRIFVFFRSMPRSAKALPSAAGCAPPGMKMKIDSGPMSFARCTKAEKSGLATREARRPADRPAGGFEGALERGLRVMTRAVVGDHGVGLLDAPLGRRPGA